MMKNPPLGCLTVSGIIGAVLTVLIVAGFVLAQGNMLFSPGALNAKTGAALGGVSSHTNIAGQCAVCHAPFWGTSTMANRCVICHTDVAAQLQDPSTLHGVTPNLSCRNCHLDHRGPNAPLTTVNHNLFTFKLTGQHVNVACASCHIKNIFKGTPTDCYSCHPEPSVHAGQFGTDCAKCHNTGNWNASFNHPGGCDGNCANHRRATCADCHPVNYSTFTCAKCHDGTPRGGGD